MPNQRLCGGPKLRSFTLPVDDDGTIPIPPEVQRETGWSNRLYPHARGGWSNFRE